MSVHLALAALQPGHARVIWCRLFLHTSAYFPPGEGAWLLSSFLFCEKDSDPSGEDAGHQVDRSGWALPEASSGCSPRATLLSSDVEFTSIATAAARASSDLGRHVSEALSVPESFPESLAEYDDVEEALSCARAPDSVQWAMQLGVVGPSVYAPLQPRSAKST